MSSYCKLSIHNYYTQMNKLLLEVLVSTTGHVNFVSQVWFRIMLIIKLLCELAHLSSVAVVTVAGDTAV